MSKMLDHSEAMRYLDGVAPEDIGVRPEFRDGNGVPMYNQDKLVHFAGVQMQAREGVRKALQKARAALITRSEAVKILKGKLPEDCGLEPVNRQADIPLYRRGAVEDIVTH